jgi:ABC-type glycerol-3-phosphate transport system substrate-binding protein
MLNKLDPKDVPDKKLITIAALTTNFSADLYIKEFNRKSTEYQIELKKYATEGMTEADQLMAFNAEFAAGKIPDVLLINSDMDYRNYVSKKMFMDLYPLLDKDTDISRDDLVQSVMKALETDGKLYSVTPHYYIDTLSGKTEIFGDRWGQSLAELKAAGAAYPNASLLAAYNTSNDVITSFALSSVQDFVNYETGECYFDTPEFISLLEVAKEYPLEIDYATFSFDWLAYMASFASNESLIMQQGISSFRDIADYEYANFDAPVTLLGYPNKSGGSGALIFPDDEVAILADAKNPEGAWEFVKGFMQYKGPENTETSTYSNYFSIMQKNMDDYAAEALEDPYYMDYSIGERVYSTHRVFLNYNIVEVPNNTPEQNAMVINLINSVEHIYRNDEALRQIISDDANIFFRGQISAEEAAAMIQNRVTTYLAEIR